MAGISRQEGPAAIEGAGVELRMRDVGGGMTAAFVRLAGGTDLRPALKAFGRSVPVPALGSSAQRAPEDAHQHRAETYETGQSF